MIRAWQLLIEFEFIAYVASNDSRDSSKSQQTELMDLIYSSN